MSATRAMGSLVLAVGFAVLLGQQAAAKERYKYRPAKFEGGKLEIINGLPVVTVTGTPAEQGKQLGKLAGEPLRELMRRQDDLLGAFGMTAAVRPLLITAGQTAMQNFPADQREEMLALGEASGVDTKFLAFGNFLYDLARLGCSVLMVEPTRSDTGGMLFGRNLDFPTFGLLDQYSVVVVYRPKGKHAFTAVSIPGMIGVVSGMNDAGLALAQLEVTESNDHAPGFNGDGVPVAMIYRRILEECTTVDQAEKLLRETPRMSLANLAVADTKTAVVLEASTKNVARRPAEAGLCACTNHFRTELLSPHKTDCWRYAALTEIRDRPHLGVEDVHGRLHAAHQTITFQTMVFEPATLKLHLALGKPPSSALPLKTLELGPMMK